MIKILVLEDDVELNQVVCSTLIKNRYDVTSCFNAYEALEKMADKEFDLILTDIMMPRMDGYEFAEEIREMNKEIPIIFMTAREDMDSKRRGYLIGIDDYIVKPFVLDELVLKIGAVLRRFKIAGNKKIEIGNFRMDEEEHMAYLNDEEIALTVREFDILYKLLSYPKKTFTRSQLMSLFWDFDSSATSGTVDVYMAKLRDKTSSCDGFETVTVHGLGYKVVLL